MTRPDRQQILGTIIEVLGGIAPEAAATTIDPARNLRDQLDIDSMDFLNLLLGLHQRLGVDIPEADYGKLQSLDALTDYLDQRLGAAA